LERYPLSRLRLIMLVLAAALVGALAACAPRVPSIDEIRDSKLLDRRIEETPRQRTLRECTQEKDQFRVSCTHCHTSGEEIEIKSPDKLMLTEVGKRAQIMRRSITFGKQQQCTNCHQAKFALNAYAQKMFGPHSAKHRKLEEELNRTNQQ
jgi:hypothetical protein